MERATAVVRSTHSANFYGIPVVSPSGSTASSSNNQPSFASTWGPSTTTTSMASSSSKHRITNPNVDLNASFHSSGGSSNQRGRGTVNADEPQFQPAFAFDVNELVSSLRRSASSSSLAAMGNSSALKRSGSSLSWQSRSMPPHSQSQEHLSHNSSSNQIQYTEQFLAPQPSDSRIQVVAVDPVLTRRGRRDALSGGENSRSQVHDNQNSIISYNMNRRKKKPIVGMPTDPSAAPPASPSTYPYSPAASPSMPVPPTPPPLYRSTSNNRRNHTPSPPPTPEFRPTTTITTPNGIEYTTETTTRTTRVTSFYEEAFTF
ncbi:hypothetical protein Gpo141_00012022 [Globisporangium polare]